MERWKPNWNFSGLWINSVVWRRKNEGYAEKTQPTEKQGRGSVMLRGNFGSSGTGNLQCLEAKAGFNQASGNPERKHHAVCEEAEA